MIKGKRNVQITKEDFFECGINCEIENQLRA